MLRPRATLGSFAPACSLVLSIASSLAPSRAQGAGPATPVAEPGEAAGDPSFMQELRRSLAGPAQGPFWSSGPELILAPRFLIVWDRALALPAPPWGTAQPYAQAFEMARAAWYATQPDRARALMVFSNFDEGGKSLFYFPLANDVAGLGVGQAAQIFDDTSDLALDGYVWMGSVELLEKAGEAYFREAFVHEIAHRWAAYVAVDHPGLLGGALLGRQASHWSFLADTGGSPMEGNDWAASGPDAYTTIFDTPPRLRFSPLDLYLMGVLPPEQVPPFELYTGWGMTDPPRHPVNASTPPAHRTGVPVTLLFGSAATVSIDDVIRANGPRVPAARDERLVWPIGIVLLVRGIEGVPLAALERLDRRIEAYAVDFEAASGSRVRLEIGLEGAGRARLGAPCRSSDECDRTVTDACLAPIPGGDRRCTRGCTFDADCGRGACCHAALQGGPTLCWPLALCPDGSPTPNPELGDGGSGLPFPGSIEDHRPTPLATVGPTAGCGCGALEPERGSSAGWIVAGALLIAARFRPAVRRSGSRGSPGSDRRRRRRSPASAGAS